MRIITILSLLLVSGCALLRGRAEVLGTHNKTTTPPATQPTGRSDATVQNVGTGVNVAAHRETGSSSTSGELSPTFTSINSQWPLVVLVLGALAVVAWLREKRDHGRTRAKLVAQRLSAGQTTKPFSK
jgi:hypothetical protein